MAKMDMADVTGKTARTARSTTNVNDASDRPAKHAYMALKRFAGGLDRRWRTTDRYRFEDRRVQSRTLICLVCGSNPEWLPIVLPALLAAAEGQYICLVSPGRFDETLRSVCRRLEWSYLGTSTRDAALAQNICYKLHPEVETIVKIDDDMVLLPGSIALLVARARALKREGIVDPSVVSPFVPLDSICYRPLLEALGLLSEFESLFGRARLAASGLPIETKPEVAEWIWRKTTPLSQTASQLASQPERIVMAPVRFRAGMIVFERSYWEEIGRFPVYRRRLMVGRSIEGTDANCLSETAMAMVRPIVYSSHILAGRIAFEAQRSAMTAMLARTGTPL